MSNTPFPLTPLEEKAKTHAILCTTGFLVLLPIGVLVARFTRTFTKRWWTAHWIIQLVISGPVILTGWAMGHQTTDTLNLGHFIDTHQKTGLTLLVLYAVQVLLGIFVHFFKFPSLFRGRRPPQNYFHVFLGLVIFILAAFQVHYGLYTEWDIAFGGLHKIPQSAKNAWLALIIVFWVLYIVGMALIPRQMRQERPATVEKNHYDHVPLRDSSQRAPAQFQ
ncbi:eukaryotic cytochrome b561-domain-containing protein [Lyophyllum atratum]|nr:eukaryotic cytochrome b561-domain-containing protein [Lyophyllum atratum]